MIFSAMALYLAVGEEIMRAIWASSSTYDHICIRIDLSYLFSLSLPIRWIILNDTDGVYPEISHLEFPAEGDSVPEDFRKDVPWDVGSILQEDGLS